MVVVFPIHLTTRIFKCQVSEVLLPQLLFLSRGKVLETQLQLNFCSGSSATECSIFHLKGGV